MSSVRVMCTLSPPITVGLMIHWQAAFLVQWTWIYFFNPQWNTSVVRSPRHWDSKLNGRVTLPTFITFILFILFIKLSTAVWQKDKTRRESQKKAWRSLEVCSVSEEPEEPRLLPESEQSSSSHLSTTGMLAVSSVRLVPVKGGSIKLWNVWQHLLNQSRGV